MNIYPKLIMDALATVRYPGTGKNIVEAEMVEDDLRISGLHVICASAVCMLVSH